MLAYSRIKSTKGLTHDTTQVNSAW